MDDETRNKFMLELHQKIDALSKTIEARMTEQLKDYPLALLEGRYTNVADYIKDHPYPLDN